MVRVQLAVFLVAALVSHVFAQKSEYSNITVVLQTDACDAVVQYDMTFLYDQPVTTEWFALSLDYCTSINLWDVSLLIGGNWSQAVSMDPVQRSGAGNMWNVSWAVPAFTPPALMNFVVTFLMSGIVHSDHGKNEWVDNLLLPKAKDASLFIQIPYALSTISPVSTNPSTATVTDLGPATVVSFPTISKAPKSGMIATVEYKQQMQCTSLPGPSLGMIILYVIIAALVVGGLVALGILYYNKVRARRAGYKAVGIGAHVGALEDKDLLGGTTTTTTTATTATTGAPSSRPAAARSGGYGTNTTGTSASSFGTNYTVAPRKSDGMDKEDVDL